MSEDQRAYDIAVIPGDGIGLEVVPAALSVVDGVGERSGFRIARTEYAWGCDHYRSTGRMMPDDALDRLSEHDAVFLGAVGHPGVPDHVSLWGLLIPIRRSFRQYVNVRPVQLLDGIRSPLRGYGPGDIDMLIVRENNEGEYSEIGGRLYEGTEDETVVQESVFTRRGVDRVMRFAFEQARKRSGRVTSATKSNGIVHTMPFWDERFSAISREYPDIETDAYHIDILTAHFVQRPDQFDVVVASNLFGDILSDLGPAVVGGLGIAPGANLNPDRDFPSMFEPVHGSAPDIAGKGVANPIAAIWTAAMMLEHLGEAAAARYIVSSIEAVTAAGEFLTPDLGGSSTTGQVTEAILQAMETMQT